MKALLVLLLASSLVQADQRLETNNGFCHFVLNAANADNEEFLANCLHGIRQNNDGTGTGAVYIAVQYPPAGAPVTEDVAYTGTDTGIPCNMVDSNGTTYSTNDWNSFYDFQRGIPRETMRLFKESFGKNDPQFDYNNDGIVNSLDVGMMKANWPETVVYSLTCRNGAQQ